MQNDKINKKQNLFLYPVPSPLTDGLKQTNKRETCLAKLN